MIEYFRLVVGLFIITMLFSCNYKNDEAVYKYQTDLDRIEFLILNDTINSAELPLLINRIELVTNIESESDGNYFGKFNPTLNDVKMWRNWLERNRNRLYYDWENDKYILR